MPTLYDRWLIDKAAGLAAAIIDGDISQTDVRVFAGHFLAEVEVNSLSRVSLSLLSSIPNHLAKQPLLGARAFDISSLVYRAKGRLEQRKRSSELLRLGYYIQALCSGYFSFCRFVNWICMAEGPNAIWYQVKGRVSRDDIGLRADACLESALDLSLGQAARIEAINDLFRLVNNADSDLGPQWTVVMMGLMDHVFHWPLLACQIGSQRIGFSLPVYLELNRELNGVVFADADVLERHVDEKNKSWIGYPDQALFWDDDFNRVFKTGHQYALDLWRGQNGRLVSNYDDEITDRSGLGIDMDASRRIISAIPGLQMKVAGGSAVASPWGLD